MGKSSSPPRPMDFVYISGSRSPVIDIFSRVQRPRTKCPGPNMGDPRAEASFGRATMSKKTKDLKHRVLPMSNRDEFLKNASKCRASIDLYSLARVYIWVISSSCFVVSVCRNARYVEVCCRYQKRKRTGIFPRRIDKGIRYFACLFGGPAHERWVV